MEEYNLRHGERGNDNANIPMFSRKKMIRFTMLVCRFTTGITDANKLQVESPAEAKPKRCTN